MKEMTVKTNQGVWTLTAMSEGIFRVQLRLDRRQRESMLTRYGIVKRDLGEVDAREENGGLIVGATGAKIEGDRVVLTAPGYTLTMDAADTMDDAYIDGGFRVRIPLADEERFFGLGDETRVTDLWQANVTSYGPIPYIMSSQGWSLMVNLTYRHRYDIGKEKADELRIDAQKGMLDIYVFLGDSMKDALDKYTSVSGRPVILPKAAYGLTFVNNEFETARDMLENGLRFRREKIPCDILGLEPGWMSKHYDYSTDKKWDPGRFYLPYWLPENYKLSLWLCCDYDLLWKEENEVREEVKGQYDGAAIVDTHFSGAVYMDQITKPGEAWFDHLKKFVDNGASAFKLDGANQVMQHPDRLFAGRYTDDEVHNVYPVIYGKQMKKGFEEHTGRRAMIYTPSMYAGQQQYCATWAGDTGGGYKTMVSIQNLAMCGHANASCDMSITDLSSIHYCSLMPWTQHLGWQNWQHPWFLGDELEGIYRDYAQLRSTLFPYIYSAAHQANETGLPISRPLSLVYEGTAKYDDVLNEYMFGDSILVSAFDMHMTLPEGRWTDYFTGKTYEGGTSFTYDPPKGKGGAMLIKDGGIIVTQAWMPHITHHNPTEYTVHVYPGADGAFTLYDDDGETYAYEKGEMVKTQFALKGNALTIGMREGKFSSYTEAKSKEEAELNEEFQPTIGEMPALVPFEVKLHNVCENAAVKLDGEAVETEWKDGCLCFRVPVSLHEKRELTYTIG